METPEMIEAIELIKRGCEMIAAQEGSSEETRRLRPAAVLLKEAATIAKTVPDAGESVELRWRIYEMIQSQGGSDNSAMYKELGCSIHMGLAGEVSEPVTLPCGHTFCKTCIAPLFAGSVSQRKCPQCRAAITITYQSLQPNTAVKGIVAHLLPRGHTYDMAAIAAADASVDAATAAATFYQPIVHGYGGGSYNDNVSGYSYSYRFH